MLAQNMFIQALAGTDAKEEAARQQRGDSGGGLRNDGWMNTHRGAGDGGADFQSLGYLRESTQHGPDKRTLALPLDPRMIVIRDHGEIEARRFCALRALDQLARRLFLAAKFVADLKHLSFP